MPCIPDQKAELVLSWCAECLWVLLGAGCQGADRFNVHTVAGGCWKKNASLQTDLLTDMAQYFTAQSFLMAFSLIKMLL